MNYPRFRFGCFLTLDGKYLYAFGGFAPTVERLEVSDTSNWWHSVNCDQNKYIQRLSNFIMVPRYF